ncbi:uncharacterized protein [Dysidea avara]|uniref:uncharacterized protein n=1 Tax=Dysidea avara TaxID=196820 RepID=UPI003328DEB3
MICVSQMILAMIFALHETIVSDTEQTLGNIIHHGKQLVLLLQKPCCSSKCLNGGVLGVLIWQSKPNERITAVVLIQGYGVIDLERLLYNQASVQHNVTQQH